MENQNHDQNRYQRGLETLSRVDGRAGGEVVARLAEFCPDMARYLVEFPFGDVYSRPGLKLREREIAVLASLSAMGNAAPQLAVHVRAALNVGLTREEIIEVGIQTAVYAGFPAALNALAAMRGVFNEIDEENNHV